MAIRGSLRAEVSFELATEAEVPGIEQREFQRHAESVKAGCPVSKVLTGVDISLDANWSRPNRPVEGPSVE